MENSIAHQKDRMLTFFLIGCVGGGISTTIIIFFFFHYYGAENRFTEGLSLVKESLVGFSRGDDIEQLPFRARKNFFRVPSSSRVDEPSVRAPSDRLADFVYVDLDSMHMAPQLTNYKSLESILAVHPSSTRIILLAPAASPIEEEQEDEPSLQGLHSRDASVLESKGEVASPNERAAEQMVEHWDRMFSKYKKLRFGIRPISSGMTLEVQQILSTALKSSSSFSSLQQPQSGGGRRHPLNSYWGRWSSHLPLSYHTTMLIRLVHLYNTGGIYSDLDFVFTAPLSTDPVHQVRLLLLLLLSQY